MNINQSKHYYSLLYTSSMPILCNHTLHLKTPVHILSLNNQPILQPSIINMRPELHHYGSTWLSITFKNPGLCLYCKFWQFLYKISLITCGWFCCIGQFETHTTDLVDLWGLDDDCVVDGWFLDWDLALNSVFLSLGSD